MVLAAEGRSFCAGADLGWMRAAKNYSEEENKADALRLGDLFHSWDTLPQCVVGRIQGAAIGGGTGLVAICDVAIATGRALFAFSEVNLGIVPAVISPFVVRKIGQHHARELFLTGERFPADRAHQVGLVNHVVPDDEALDAKVQEVVANVLTSAPQAVGEAKALLRQLEHLPESQVLPFTTGLIARLRTGEEGQEGMAAFFDKRSPSWKPTDL